VKYLVIIGDGMADFPLDELGGKTPLMVARKPHMDMMASMGFCGKVLTIPPGFPTGSDVACMSIFGYDPAKHYTGRAPIEAYGIGIPMNDGDVAFRCNLVHLEIQGPRVLMGDYSAGHITTNEASVLIKDLNDVFGTEAIHFFQGVSYRHIMIWKDGVSEMNTTPPHDILDRDIAEYMPSDKGSERLTKLMSDSQILLNGHPVNKARIAKGLKPANSIWLWGQGEKPVFPHFKEKYGSDGAVVTAVDLVKGIGNLIGFDTPHIAGATGYFDTDYKGKARAALDLLSRHDIVYIHVEAPDEASHEGNVREKIQAIERIDEDVVGFLLEQTPKDTTFLLATDHATPIVMRTHYGCPVPFVIYRKDGAQTGAGCTYDENAGDMELSGEEMVHLFLKG
jgi:2,3-bisphosphoglycerate-independent phosphoglycerate mutase